MKIIVLQAFSHKAQHYDIGETVDVTGDEARTLVLMGRAKYETDDDADDTETEDDQTDAQAKGKKKKGGLTTESAGDLVK